MPDSHFPNFLGLAHMNQIWPVQSDGQGNLWLLRKVSLPHERIQNRKATFCATEHVSEGMICLG